MSRFAPPIAWAVLIFVASSLPGTSLPSPGALHLDKAAHAAAYAVLAGLLARAFGKTTLGGLAMSAGIAGLYGIFDEIHQSFVPGRDADAWDAVADAAGAAAGAWLWRYGWAQTRAKS